MKVRAIRPAYAETWALAGLSTLLTVLTLIVFLPGGETSRNVVLGLIGTAAAAYAATVHPRSIFVAFAVVLGAAPYMHVPGTDIPALLVLAVGIWPALASMPDVRFRPGWCEVVLIAVAGMAWLSVMATGVSKTAAIEYAAWIAATAAVTPIRLLSPEARALTARAFTVSAAAAALVGAWILVGVPGVITDVLGVLGFDASQYIPRVVGSETTSDRLAGTLIQPNIAGLILAAGLVTAAAFFRGPVRVGLLVVIGAGLTLTLSRAAIATVVVIGILVAVRSPSHRLRILGGAVVGFLLSLTLPGVRERFADSFGPTDVGTSARRLAVEEFPGLMEGHWLWGLGWARDEFRDQAVGQTVNFAANGPLATVYRGGLILGIAVTLVAVLLVVRSWMAAGNAFDDTVVCCGVIAFLLVAVQLDFSVVLQPPATAVVSLLIGLSLGVSSRVSDSLSSRSLRA
jgi:hypothetical protein